MGVELDIHLPFSYWRTESFDGACPATRPEARTAQAYAAAIAAEIESLGTDLGEAAPEVGGVFFSGGYLGLLDADTFRDVLRAVRRCFPVAAGGLAVDAVTFPGALDMYVASAYLDEHMGALMFETPTLSATEAARAGLPNTLQALDKSVYVLRSYGAAELGIRLPVDVLGRTEDTWRYLAGQVTHYQPEHVELVGAPAAGGSDAASADPSQFVALLCERGYHRVTDGFLTRLDVPPAYIRARAARAAGGEYLGVGLGAESCVGGYYTKNTTDLHRYLSHAGDCRALIDEVREA